MSELFRFTYGAEDDATGNRPNSLGFDYPIWQPNGAITKVTMQRNRSIPTARRGTAPDFTESYTQPLGRAVTKYRIPLKYIPHLAYGDNVDSGTITSNGTHFLEPIEAVEAVVGQRISYFVGTAFLGDWVFTGFNTNMDDIRPSPDDAGFYAAEITCTIELMGDSPRFIKGRVNTPPNNVGV